MTQLVRTIYRIFPKVYPAVIMINAYLYKLKYKPNLLFLVEINECDSGPCLNGGNCTDRLNAYSCECLSGWDGHSCEISEHRSWSPYSGGSCGARAACSPLSLFFFVFLQKLYQIIDYRPSRGWRYPQRNPGSTTAMILLKFYTFDCNMILPTFQSGRCRTCPWKSQMVGLVN